MAILKTFSMLSISSVTIANAKLNSWRMPIVEYLYSSDNINIGENIITIVPSTSTSVTSIQATAASTNCHQIHY